MENPEMEKKILTVLNDSNKKERRKGLSIEELSKLTGACRTTISKHVGILEAKNKVIIENCGNIKLIYLNKDGK